MKRSAAELATFPDNRLFDEVSQGIDLIVKNAIILDDAAKCLHEGKQFRVSEVIRGHAAEEAAKVLILIDLIRCPLSNNQKIEVAKRFYSHLIKRIYAENCQRRGAQSFGELTERIKMECYQFHLDGPNKVDWIFPNSIIAKREQNLYVDFVRDLTEAQGEYYWLAPYDYDDWFAWMNYETPMSVQLSSALCYVGASSPDGLSVIANLWRKFEPKLETESAELEGLISLTLEQLASIGTAKEYEVNASLIMNNWPFPLWSLDIQELKMSPEELRKERKRYIAWIESIDAKRQPRPAICKPTVKTLHNAYLAWQKEVEAQDDNKRKSKNGNLISQARSYGSEMAKQYKLESYRTLEKLYRQLTADEKAALLALGWYAKERGVADWPNIYERAIEFEKTTKENYKIGYVHLWLDGLTRWESPPKPFEPGQMFLKTI